MTRVLLIADTERVQRIFQSMAEQDLLQLQTASTLALGEFELTSFSPDFTFVQSRISGFSGDILLRHLDKMLPAGGKLVLLAGDSEDAAQAKRHGRTSLDLTVEDALLETTIAALLTGAPLPAPPLPEEAEPAKPATAKAKSATPPQPTAGGQAPPKRVEPEEATEVAEREEAAVPAAPPRVAPFEPTPAAPAVADEYPPPARVPGKAAASAFEEAMQQAEAKVAPMDASLLEVEDLVEVGKGAHREPAAREVLQTPAAPDGVKGAGGYYAGETVADALRRAERKKRRNPYLFIIPALVVIAVPLASYLAGKSSAPRPSAAPAAKQEEKRVAVLPPPAQKAPASAASVPAPSAPSQPAVPPAVPNAAPAPASPPAAPAPKVPAAPKMPAAPAATPGPAAQPRTPPATGQRAKGQAQGAATRGIEKLPPLLEGTKLDAEYGKKHPGWVRYLGLRAEYKLFRENGVYRAIQVIPVPGGIISDDLFKRILRQFGGVDSYSIESTARKGDYLVEQCATPGPAAVTIYRNKDNKKMKALVVYYR